MWRCRQNACLVSGGLEGGCFHFDKYRHSCLEVVSILEIWGACVSKQLEMPLRDA